jgi:hypothetical protein
MNPALTGEKLPAPILATILNLKAIDTTDDDSTQGISDKAIRRFVESTNERQRGCDRAKLPQVKSAISSSQPQVIRGHIAKF